MGLKSKVRTHTVTTHATLTTRGREILSREGKIDATKYAFSDEEIDYTLWADPLGPRKHRSGDENAPFRVIMDTPMLEATPNRTKFNSHLLPDELNFPAIKYDDSILPLRVHYDIHIGTLHNPRASWEALIGIHPTTKHRPKRLIKNEEDESKNHWKLLDPPAELSEEYIFTIENTNVVRFTRYYVGAYETSPWLSDIPGSGDTIEAKGIEFQPQRLRAKAATTITVQGIISGITKVCSIETVPDVNSSVFAGASPVDVTDPKFY